MSVVTETSACDVVRRDRACIGYNSRARQSEESDIISVTADINVELGKPACV